MIDKNLWTKITGHIRQSVWALFNNQGTIKSEELKSVLQLNHVGFFISLESSTNSRPDRIGFLRKGQNDAYESMVNTIKQLYGFLCQNGKTENQFAISRLWTTIIYDVVPIRNPLEWEPGVDGVYLQFGDKYRGFYLPYETENLKRQDVLDRLATWELNIPSDVWKLPEGIVFRIVSEYGTG